MSAIQNLDKAPAATLDNLVKTPTYKTRRAAFALNRKKLTRNLKKDALINTYETVCNNFDENVNIKCSSGFFLEVISPGFLSLARQSSNAFEPLVIDDVAVVCTNERASIDNGDLLLNTIFSFNLCDSKDVAVILASVTVHCHITTKLVQLQGSKLVKGMKAPVWFHDNVLKDTLERESIKRKGQIDQANAQVLNMPSGSMNTTECFTCNKKFIRNDKSYKCTSCSSTHHKKCTTEKSNKSRTQPKGWKCSSCLPSIETVSRKRSIIISDDESAPPLKTIALGSSSPTSAVGYMSTASSISSPGSQNPHYVPQPTFHPSGSLTFQPTGIGYTTMRTPGPTVQSVPLPPRSSLPLSIRPSLLHMAPPVTSSTPELTDIGSGHAGMFSLASSNCVFQPSGTDVGLGSLNYAATPFVPLSLGPTLSCSAVTRTINVLTPSITVSTLPPATSSFPQSSPLSSVPSTSVSLSTSRTATSRASGNKSKSMKNKATIATDPIEFEKENLRVERDTCKLKIIENDNTIKHLKEQVHILSTRCNLFEKQRNDDAYKNLNLIEAPPPNVPPTTPTATPPAASPSPSDFHSSSIESLINLEVLRAVKTVASPPKPPSPSIQELVDQLSDLKISLSSQINLIRSEINIPLSKCQSCKHPSNLPPTSIPVELNSSDTGRTQSEQLLSSASTQTAPLPRTLWFPLPPPQIPCKRDMSSQATVSSKASKSASTQVSFLEKQVKAHPLKNSLLGKPPKERRIRGQFEPLSKSFLHQHSSCASEKVRSVNISDDKVVNQRNETSNRNRRKKSTKKPPASASEILLVDLSAPPLLEADQNTPVEEPLIDFEIYLSAPDISDDFGDPTPTISPDQMYDLNTQSSSQATDHMRSSESNPTLETHLN